MKVRYGDDLEYIRVVGIVGWVFFGVEVYGYLM